MHSSPTRLTRFNTASIAKLTAYRVVLDGQVLTLSAHLACQTQLWTMSREDEGGDDKDVDDDDELRDPQRAECAPSEAFFESALVADNIDCSLPAWRLAEQALMAASSAQDGQHRVGLLVPFDRMFFIGGYLQRKGVQVSFASCGSDSDEGKTRSRKPWLRDFRLDRLLYIACPPQRNPFTLLAEFNSSINAAYDYEKWYYAVKGVRVLVPPPFQPVGSAPSTAQRRSIDPLTTAGFYPLSTDDVRALYKLNVHSKRGQVPLTGSDVQLFQQYCAVMDRYLRHFYFLMLGVRGVAAEQEKLGRTTTELLRQFDQPSSSSDGVDVISEWNKNGVFMRLSSRSPKDFLLHLVVASFSGEDIVNRLVKSGRSKFCLSEYLMSTDPGRAMHVIFMPWDQEMGSSCEFRCFVHNKRLNAISQYDPYSLATPLQNHARALYFRDQIVDFHEQIKHRIPFPSYIMDVVVRQVHLSSQSASSTESQPSSSTESQPASSTESQPASSTESQSSEQSQSDEHYEVNLIEFNPFYGDISSGAALFEWVADYDLLYHGCERTVIRIRVPTKGRQWDPQGRPTVLDLM